MNVTYLIKFTVKAGERQRFLDLLNGVLDQMRHEANFRAATLHMDPEDSSAFLLHETWADHQDVLDVQLQQPYRKAWHEALPGLLERPREISTWQPLRSDLGGFGVGDGALSEGDRALIVDGTIEAPVQSQGTR